MKINKPKKYVRYVEIYYKWAEAHFLQDNEDHTSHSEDSDQPMIPRILTRVFAGHFMGNQGSSVPSGDQRRLWSACAGALADLSLRWAHKCFAPAYM